MSKFINPAINESLKYKKRFSNLQLETNSNNSWNYQNFPTWWQFSSEDLFTVHINISYFEC